MTVHILLTCEDHTFQNATMTLDTVRIGFPTAKIVVDVNCIDPRLSAKILTRFVKAGLTSNADINQLKTRVHHFDWIRHKIETSQDDTIVLLDGDCVFWKSCEDWTFYHPFAGYYTPSHFNPWFHSWTSARLHTHMLWIRPKRVLAKIENANAQFVPYPVWCEVNYFSPQLVWDRYDGRTMYDTCAQLYCAVGGEWFTSEHKDCYDHLNSASFYDATISRFPEPYKSQFIHLHETCQKDPSSIRGLWHKIDALYLEWAAHRPNI